MFAGNSLWYLITQSDLMSWIVLLTLLLLSIVCWAIFFGKYMITRVKMQQLRAAYKKLYSINTLEQLDALAIALQDTVPGYIIAKQRTVMKSVHDWQLVAQHGEQVLDTLVCAEENYLAVLSTSAAVSPLLGLFGTVWGLVQAFIGISERQAADIVAVAPGIAQALVTTLAGLVVAIPALVMFNYLQARALAYEQELITFINTLNLSMARIGRE
jgi:biopolymer transport protein ExbB/TolQ